MAESAAERLSDTSFKLMRLTFGKSVEPLQMFCMPLYKSYNSFQVL